MQPEDTKRVNRTINILESCVEMAGQFVSASSASPGLLAAGKSLSCWLMKKTYSSILFAFTLGIFSSSFALTATAQINPVTATNFLNTAITSGDSQLSSIASELTGKAQALGASSTNSTLQNGLNGMLKSLAGGSDSNALTSAFSLASAAKLTSSQTALAKQVGGLASAYVVQKNFSSLTGSQGDVATVVQSLRTGSYTSAAVPLKNIASNASLTDTQKQLLSSVTDKYVPGLSNIGNSVNSLKKLF